MVLIAHPDSLNRLQPSFLLVLLGLLCLSIVARAQGQTTTPTSAAATTTTGAGNPSGLPSGTPTGTATGTTSGTATGIPSGTPTGALPLPTPSIPTNASSSFLTLVAPPTTLAVPPLFAIGSNIQFAWTFDQYLLARPANLTIEAFTDSTIITIGQGLPGTTTNYTWMGASQTNLTHPLATAMYTLRIYDGAIGRSGSSRPGYLTTYIGLKFGLYIRDQGAQSDPNVCATCDFASTKNSAMRTMVPAFSTLVLAVMSTLSLMH